MAEAMAPAAIELTVVDKASATLAHIKGKSDELSKSADSIKSAWSSGLLDSFTKGPALAAVGIMGAIATAAVGAGAYLVHLAKGAAESQAGLKSLSEVTGATVEGLSAIRTVAKTSGVEMEAIGGAMTKLAKNSVVGGEEISRAYKAIGLSLADMKGQSTDQQFVAIAKALEGYQDGAEKTALAQILMGKSGAQMLPVMRDIAENGDLVVKVTAAQAREADDLEKNMRRLSAAQEAWKKVLGTALVPVLGDVVKVMLQVQTETGGMNAQAKQLSADGSLRSWAEGAAIGVAYLIDIVQGLWGVVKSVGTAIAGFAAASMEVFGGLGEAAVAIIKGNYSELPGIVSRGSAAVVAIAKAAGQDIVTAMTPTMMVDRLKAQFAASAAAVGAGADAMKPKIDGLAKPAEEAKEKINALEKALSELMNKLNNPDVDQEWVKQTQLLTRALQVGAIGWADYADAIAKTTSQSKTVVDANKAIADSLKINEDLLDRNRQSIEDASRAMVEGNKALTEEITGLSMTKQGRELYNLALRKTIDLRRIEATATGEERDMRIAELDALYATREELIKHRDVVEENANVYRSWNSTATDFLANLAENGRSAFGDLYSQAKKFGAQLLAIFAQKYILGMEVQGGGGLAGGVLNMLMGGGGGAGTGSVLQGLTAGLSSLTGGATAFLGVLGPIGLAIGAVAAIVTSLTKRENGFKIDNSTVGVSNPASHWTPSALGAFDYSGRGTNAKDFAPLTAQVNALDDYIAKNLLGADTLAQVKANIQALQNSTKWENLDKAGIEAGTKTFLQQRYATAFDAINEKVAATIRSFSGTSDELLKFIDDYIAMTKVVAAAQESVNNVLGDTASAVDDIMTGQKNSVLAAYAEQTRAAQALAAIAPDSAYALSKVVNGMSSLRSAAVALLVQIEQVRGAVSDMFGDTIRSLQLSILSPEDQYKFLQNEADSLLQQALTSTDPLQIQNLLSRLNSDVNQAMGLLSPEQRAALVPEQIARLQDINKQIGDHLNAIKDTTNENLAAATKQLADALPAIMQSMLDAAAKQDAAADKNKEAADTIRKEEITVNVITGEVGVQTSLVGG